jgi:hypothetical protein
MRTTTTSPVSKDMATLMEACGLDESVHGGMLRTAGIVRPMHLKTISLQDIKLALELGTMGTGDIGIVVAMATWYSEWFGTPAPKDTFAAHFTEAKFETFMEKWNPSMGTTSGPAATTPATSFDPFHAWKYEEEMRQRRRSREELRQRRERKAAFTLSRHHQQQQQAEETFRCYQLQKLRQDRQNQEYKVVQDIYGQLFIVPSYETRPPIHRNESDHTLYESTSASDVDSNETEDSFVQAPEGRVHRIRDSDEKTQHRRTHNAKALDFAKPEMNDILDAARKIQKPSDHHRVAVIVEDASDSESNERGSLDYTLRNRRPPPDKWLEPVETMM